MSRAHTDATGWSAACKAPSAAARRWLQHRANAEVLDTRPPTRRSSDSGEEVQVVASVATKSH